jgi:hypothetical protein
MCLHVLTHANPDGIAEHDENSYYCLEGFWPCFRKVHHQDTALVFCLRVAAIPHLAFDMLRLKHRKYPSSRERHMDTRGNIRAMCEAHSRESRLDALKVFDIHERANPS